MNAIYMPLLNGAEQFLVVELCNTLEDAALLLERASHCGSHAEFVRLTLPLFSALKFIEREVRALRIVGRSGDTGTLECALQYLTDAVALLLPPRG